MYLAIACFDVDGGSSSSHGHTDTETAAFSVKLGSSHGQTALAPPLDSIFSDIDFDPSLKYLHNSICRLAHAHKQTTDSYTQRLRKEARKKEINKKKFTQN